MKSLTKLLDSEEYPDEADTREVKCPKCGANHFVPRGDVDVVCQGMNLGDRDHCDIKFVPNFTHSSYNMLSNNDRPKGSWEADQRGGNTLLKQRKSTTFEV